MGMQIRGIVIGAVGTVAAGALAFAGVLAANADDDVPEPASTTSVTVTPTPTPEPTPEPTVEVTVEPAPVVEEPVVVAPPVAEPQAPVVDVPSSEGGGTTRQFGDVQVFIPDPIQPDPSTQIGAG